MQYTLRRMEPVDVPVVAAIDRLSFPTPWPAGAFRRELKKEHAYYYVLLRPRGADPSSSGRGHGSWLCHLFDSTMKNRTIGYVGFRLEDHTGHITTIAVHPDWRGKGLGDLLLAVALDKMTNRGIDRATLEMRPSNDVAHDLYQKYGFEVKLRRRRYYQDGEDALVMAASIGTETYQCKLDQLWDALEEKLRRQDIEVRQKDYERL